MRIAELRHQCNRLDPCNHCQLEEGPQSALMPTWHAHRMDMNSTREQKEASAGVLYTHPLQLSLGMAAVVSLATPPCLLTMASVFAQEK